jgi:purine-binding chemotaxis protein CheW
MTSLPSQTEAEEQLIATFLLGDNIFGIDTGMIQEVVMVGELTPVHHAPAYVAGIRNLRGRIITVVDLRVRLEMEYIEPGRESRILIVDWKNEPVGLLVDSVADTMELAEGTLQPPPPNLHGVQMEKLLGVFHCGERLGGLLDPAIVLDLSDGTGEVPTARKAGE